DGAALTPTSAFTSPGALTFSPRSAVTAWETVGTVATFATAVVTGEVTAVVCATAGAGALRTAATAGAAVSAPGKAGQARLSRWSNRSGNRFQRRSGDIGSHGFGRAKRVRGRKVVGMCQPNRPTVSLTQFGRKAIIIPD